jgi:hypothetical protein
MVCFVSSGSLDGGDLPIQKFLNAYKNAPHLAQGGSFAALAKEVPALEEILIYNRSKLKSTIASCVNSLRGECMEIFSQVCIQDLKKKKLAFSIA